MSENDFSVESNGLVFYAIGGYHPKLAVVFVKDTAPIGNPNWILAAVTGQLLLVWFAVWAKFNAPNLAMFPFGTGERQKPWARW